MNQLALFSITNDECFPVNCRDVHEKVQSKKNYNSWIRAKIKRFNFTEKVDFTPNMVKTSLNGSGVMLKELCLVENL